MRGWKLWLALVLLPLGVLELAIRQLDLFAAARGALPRAGPAPARPADAPANDKQLHPFWGWMVRPSAPSAGAFEPAGHRNRFGFISTIDDYRDVAPDDFAIGIFGGSVAAGVATWGGDEIASVLARERPELASKIRILNFGSGSYKQPQQLAVLGQMILLGVPLDYVVNVDGLNEVALGAIDVEGGQHPLFPARPQMQALALVAAGAATDAFYETSAEILRERRAAERIEARAAGWLSRSELARAFAGALAGRHRRRAAALDAQLQAQLVHDADAGSLASLPDACLERKQGCWGLIASLWARASLLMAAESAVAGAGYLHVLQPSQYVPDSKRLTPEEQQQAYARGSIWMLSVRKTYPLLLAQAAQLASRGVDFLDLTRVFVDVRDPIYTDICCHVNEAGYSRIGERIGLRIAQRLAGKPGAAPRERR